MDGGAFCRLLHFLKECGYAILDPEEYICKALRDALQPYETCVTFDDSLKCQFDIAKPILDGIGMKAFWFVYTSPMCGELERLEVYRHFRFSRFADVEDFYSQFFKNVMEGEHDLGISYAESSEGFLRSGYCGDFAFYTESDRKYRYFRDIVLGPEKYFAIVDKMISDSGYDAQSHRDVLWLSEGDIERLHGEGHYIGLHGHTHPTNMGELPYCLQMSEYRRNSDIIQSIVGSRPEVVSYPCGSYNGDTESIMRELGVVLGFDAQAKTVIFDKMHIPREDHANIVREMRSGGIGF
jgi:peptidoglycan/xylan/chitin deacetylase (PgdA/CDA1 family)